jgi:multiple sugar transport system substrate-binding protein
MLSKQQEDLNAIIVPSGRMTRRTLLKHASAIGLLGWLLEACDTPATTNTSTATGGTPVTITWESEHDDKGIYSLLVQTFNNTNRDGIRVNYINGPPDSGQQHDEITSQLQKGQGPDVLSMDVIWTDEFASNKWIVPLSDQYTWPGSERSKYLSVPLQAATAQGKIWAAPFRTDVGLLYYRTDITLTPPKTWAELITQAEQAQSSGQTKYGYVWQGAWYEGLVCDFVEVMESFGGHVLDPNDPTKVTVNSSGALQALTEMVSWVGTISPSAIITFKEGDTLSTFQSGDAAFMRNWLYAYSESSDASQSRVAGKFDVAPLPSNTLSAMGHSCIGGWQLALNAFSSKQKQDAAWQFIRFLIQEDAQQFAAINGAFTVTLQSIYSNRYVLEQNPFFAKLGPIFQQARLRPRPNSPRYQDISKAIQKRVYQALTKQSTPIAALNALQTDLQQIVSNK